MIFQNQTKLYITNLTSRSVSSLSYFKRLFAQLVRFLGLCQRFDSPY